MRPAKTFAIIASSVVLTGLLCWLAASSPVGAHCDTLDGPVVTDAQAALEKGEVTPVLKWVREEDEGAVKAAFTQALAVRAHGNEARMLADRYFFETLVRLHRAAEGAPFTGLKPAESAAPPLAAADRAIRTGDVQGLANRIAEAARTGITTRFEQLMEARKHKEDSVEAGRTYVAAYVEFIHYVRSLHGAVAAETSHHE